MLKPRNCIYCDNGSAIRQLMIEIAALDGAKLYLFKNQSYKGRCVLALDQHVAELFELSDADRNRFAAHIAMTAQALKRAFGADKINYGIYGDTMPHLHIHLVPKFEHAVGWGRPFEMNPQPGHYLTDAGYEAVLSLIRGHLRA
jgi:diadenosine tetraphosphate (Ap4A) HIT family hydrolase